MHCSRSPEVFSWPSVALEATLSPSLGRLGSLRRLATYDVLAGTIPPEVGGARGLLEFIHLGWIDFVVGSPPCSTWSRARFLPNGPRPLRFRGPAERGRKNLWEHEEARVDEANLLFFNTSGLM